MENLRRGPKVKPGLDLERVLSKSMPLCKGQCILRLIKQWKLNGNGIR